MDSALGDIQQTLEFAQSHDTARGMLPFSLGALLLGTYLLVSYDGNQSSIEYLLLGGLSVAASAFGLAIYVFSMRRPAVASIVLSTEGVLFRDFSNDLIPWDEICEVGTAELSLVGEFSSTRVTKLVVSRRYFRSLGLSSAPDSRIAKEGDPSAIYLAYYHRLPFDEFQTAVKARWQVYHRPRNSFS